jgi:thiamine kinase-like enzyme
LHSLRPPAGAHRVELQQVVADYLQTLSTHDRQQSLAAGEQALVTARLLDGHVSDCLCHNDVHSLNLIDAGNLKLIDWEYAGIGSPLFDLASVCVYHNYGSLRRQCLLSAYARPDVASIELLNQACVLFDYIRELWTQVRGLQVSDEGRDS